ncbi:hypothetical protein H072_11596 [Dactylellina haptotyla CBS 200.50]|uniref:Uncharacterized protein n=1 Tax=Dactylellina haptotyla (strain CBS 200.50) TaxID=1284197 RepID=S7ZX71_DACHA|nr:hypothetical protein H072_11596 [Dactylellina haptotyla CBS 200.50]
MKQTHEDCVTFAESAVRTLRASHPEYNKYNIVCFEGDAEYYFVNVAYAYTEVLSNFGVRFFYHTYVFESGYMLPHYENGWNFQCSGWFAPFNIPNVTVFVPAWRGQKDANYLWEYAGQPNIKNIDDWNARIKLNYWTNLDKKYRNWGKSDSFYEYCAWNGIADIGDIQIGWCDFSYVYRKEDVREAVPPDGETPDDDTESVFLNLEDIPEPTSKSVKMSAEEAKLATPSATENMNKN